MNCVESHLEGSDDIEALLYKRLLDDFGRSDVRPKKFSVKTFGGRLKTWILDFSF